MNRAVLERPVEGGIDEPVLLDERQTVEAPARHVHLEVVAAPGAVQHLDLSGVGEGTLEEAAKLVDRAHEVMLVKRHLLPATI